MRSWILALAASVSAIGVVQAQDWNRPPAPRVNDGFAQDVRPVPNGGNPAFTPLPPQPPLDPTPITPFGTCQPGCWRVHGWVGVDYLAYFPSTQPVPTLVTADAPGVAILIGGHVGYGLVSGFRIDAGFFLDSADLLAAQTIYDQLIRKTETLALAGTVFLQTHIAGAPTPFAVTNLTFQTWTQFNNVEGLTLLRLWNTNTWRIYGIVGTKFMSLEEDVNLVYTAGAGPLFDEFHTRNVFYGVQAGLKMVRCSGPWEFDLSGKLALGGNYTNTMILGANTINAPSQLLTNDANIGNFENTVFSVSPEINANLTYYLSDRLSVRIGYNFLAYTNVQRPGSQIVPNIGPAFAAPHLQPAFPNVRETFVIHGLNLGAAFHY